MTGAVMHRINEAMFIELILFDDLRLELLSTLDERSSDLRWINLLEIVAPKCEATPDQLGRAVRILDAEPHVRARELLAMLLFHPDVPADVLVQLARQDKHITELGHRAGPRELLELLAEKHRYAEAVTTLALRYYGAHDAPESAFREFLRRYEDVEMLSYNVRRSDLDERRRAIVREVFGGDEY